MEPAIVKGFEMGTHMIPITFDSPLCWMFWVLFLLGFGGQSLLHRKRGLRFAWPGLLLAGLIGCEIACQIIVGWELVLWAAVYFYVLTILLGALLGMMAFWLRQGGRRRAL